MRVMQRRRPGEKDLGRKQMFGKKVERHGLRIWTIPILLDGKRDEHGHMDEMGV